MIAELGGFTNYLGVTTTNLSDGSTTNPITIGGSSVTAQSGDIVTTSSDHKEYIFNGTIWQQFGDLSALGDLAYINTDNNTGHYLRGDGTWQNIPSVTYTAFTGKPTANQTPAFGGTATISQISQSTAGQVSGTDRTIKIPDTIATYAGVGLVKPFLSWTGTATGPTPATSTGSVTVQHPMNGSLDYHLVEIDSTGRLFVNVPIDQVFNVISVTSKNALNSGIQGAIYDNGRVNKGSGTTAVVIYGIIDITTAFTADSITFEKCKYACTIEVDAYDPTGNTIARVFMQGLPSSGASVTNGALYFAEFSISSTDPFREPTVSWRKIGALAWKDSASGNYDKATGGSCSTSLKIPTSKTVAVSVESASPSATAATNEVSYVASVSNETLTLNKIKYTTGASITVPSSGTAYSGTITPTHTSTSITVS